MKDRQNQALNERVQKGIQRRKAIDRWGALAVHAVVAIASIIAFGVLLPILDDPKVAGLSLPFNPQVMLGVLIILQVFALSVHLVSALADSGRLDKSMASEVVTRELGQQFIDDQLARQSEKPKRDSAHLESDYVTIDDEGELVPDEEARRHSAET